MEISKINLQNCYQNCSKACLPMGVAALSSFVVSAFVRVKVFNKSDQLLLGGSVGFCSAMAISLIVEKRQNADFGKWVKVLCKIACAAFAFFGVIFGLGLGNVINEPSPED